MKTLLYMIGLLLAVVALLALIFGGKLFGLETKRYFAPRHAEIDRQVFEHTPSFVHGKIQYLARLRQQYEDADTEASRKSLRSLIKTEAAVVDPYDLPADLRAFTQSL